ncbi:probable 2-carboxy-D-arabinitol-1-phosphatase isoform X2 [Brassica rapa]|uniref:probable 2-carboxy-D-arabinitol-1-phosphatase isoform X2 n=1 Tax=Brassica campestris TaxID=3711 RepID=UPI0004F14DB4|nr:probable 2-carboxy-D-arabinitol-1-phosphatase isoform X2 [Brassica rapa]
MISLPHITAISPNRSLLHSFNRPVYTRRHDQRKERTTMSSSSSSSPTTAKRVVLVRHGQSTWNEEGRIQGSSDFSILTTKGESQADISRQMLVEDSFDVCFTSPLKRSKKTAEIIWGSREAEMIFDYDLREIDLYSFQGLLKKEGKEKFGEAFGQWQEDPANFVIDGHYPVRELWSRAGSCWNGVLAHESNSVLVVAHNAVNQALVSTAIGLGTEYFRRLLQSNCGVSVLDFIPRADGGSPHVCLNRLNQTPSSPIAGGSSGGRKASKQIILVCHGQGDNEASTNDQPMNMLGVIQSQKTAELLLDLRVASIVCSSSTASTETAGVISHVQEAAGCLGVDSVPRYVNTKQMNELDVDDIIPKSNKDIQSGWLSQLDEETVSTLWNRSKKAWESLLDKLSDEDTGDAMVVVGSSVAHISLIAQCLNLDKKCLELFHLDAGSISVIDFPDGPSQRGVIRCTNYTAHLGRWSVPITRSV